MKKFYASLCMLSTAATIMAGVAPTLLTGTQKQPIAVQAGTPFNYLRLPESKKAPVQSRAAEGTEVEVTLQYDSEKYHCGFLQVANAEHSYSEFPMSNSVIIDDVEPGDYYLIVSFSNLADYTLPGSLYVVKKISVYSGESSWVTIKPEMATETVAFDMVLPDGKAPVLPTATPETMNNSSLLDRTNANVDEVAAFFAIANDEIGTVMLSSGNQNCTVEGTQYGPLYQAIGISPLDDTWHIGAVRWMKTMADEYYLTSSTVNGTSTKPEVNSTEFEKWDYAFAQNPVCEEFNTPANMYGFTATPLINGTMDPMGFLLYAKMQPQFYMAKPKGAASEKWDFNYAIELNKVEYDVDIITNWGSMPDIRSIMAPLVSFGKDTGKLTYLAAGSSHYGSPLWWNEEGSNPLVYPGNVTFEAGANNQLFPLGSTAPVAVGNMVVYAGEEDEPNELSFTTTYVGLYGEGRCADDAMSTAKFTANGETTECPMDEFEKQFDQIQAEKKTTGAFTLEFLNDKNIVFQGVKGYNNLRVDVANGSGSDVCPPTFTMLQFRDNAGQITNAFSKASDGVIMLSGADFNFVEDKEAFDCVAPASIKVEYAPAGSDDFKEIAVEEDADKFYLPEYGFYWSGSLKDVEGMTAAGHYQLRLTMTDAAGNSQTQTIFPAFSVAEFAGIDHISADDAAQSNAPVVYYNLQGKRVAEPSNGVYIRVQGSRATKVMVR